MQTYTHTHTYIHTCMCTYRHTHTCVHPHIRADMQTNNHSYLRTNKTYIHTHIHTYAQTYIHTYIHSYIPTLTINPRFRDALPKLGAKLGIWENVITALHWAKDSKGELQPPASDIIKADMKKQNKTVVFNKCDSQMYLVKQRRNRVWGLVTAGHTNEDELQARTRETLRCLESHTQFSSEDCFEPNLPAMGKPLEATAQEHLKQALESADAQGKGSDVFLDTSVSNLS